MIVRLILLVVLAVAVATGAGGSADVLSADSIGVVAEVADGEPMDALGVEPARIPVPTCHAIPLVLHGTEVELSSPAIGRVFRPPRISFV